MSDSTRDIFRAAARNLEVVADGPYVDAIARAIDLLADAFRRGNKLLVFGNGGSSADAQHLTAELVCRFVTERRPLPAIALTTNQAVLTAWSNDHAFEEVFARQIEALGVAGDVAWGISTSGRSPNVINGLRAARARGLRTIALTGASGSGLGEMADVVMAVPAQETARIQEVHLVTYHAVCAALDARFGSDDAARRA